MSNTPTTISGFGAYFIILGVVILIWILSRIIHRLNVSHQSAQIERSQMEEKERERRLAAEKERKRSTEPFAPDITLPSAADDKPIVYRYPDVKIKPASFTFSSLMPGKALTLNDTGSSIEVYQDTILLGYLPENRLAGMVRDWNKNGDPYLSYLSFCSRDLQDVQIALAFYEDKLSKLLERNPDALRVKLSGKPEEFASPSAGAQCVVDYDMDKDKYFVSFEDCIIGALPASAVKYASDHEIDPEDLNVYISDVDYDADRDRDIITVYVFD